MLSAGPLALGIDNQVVVTRGTKMVSEINPLRRRLGNQGLTPQQADERVSVMQQKGKKWPMTKHGDLWQVLWRGISIRGAGATVFTKVKGHATDKDIAEGRADQYSKDGNDQADEQADLGMDAIITGLGSMSIHL